MKGVSFMKKVFLIFIIFIVNVIKPSLYCDEPTGVCGFDTTGQNQSMPLQGPQTVQLVVCFLDFPDGRINGIPPSTTEELNNVQNIDAVSLMGYLSNNGTDFTAIPNKYTYNDMWNYYFSQNTYLGEAHPDWSSHGYWGLPHIPSENPDIAKGWGSVKDYYLETSYGNVNIIPFQTHTTNSGNYNYGIVNNINTNNGNIYIKPIMLNREKGTNGYNIPNDYDTEYGSINQMLFDAKARLIYCHQLPQNNPDYIEFDINNYTGKIIYRFAGTMYHVGGLTDYLFGQNIILREKLVKNTKNDNQDASNCIIDGPWISCHELGHTFGFDHSYIGDYDVMNQGTPMKNCPSHFNILSKLRAGWINPSHIRIVRTAQDILDLPPSEYNGDCALVTIYGSPGFNNNYEHSEYFVFENRRMLTDDQNIKFDKKFVWNPQNIPDPQYYQFNGGCLVTRSDFKIISAYEQTPIEIVGSGHSNHFWGVPVLNNISGYRYMLDIDGRTVSSIPLRTGINVNNIYGDYNGNYLKFSPSWSFGEPPVYDFVLYGQSGLSNPLNLSGNIFIHQIFSNNSISNGITINIAPGTTLDFRNIHDTIATIYQGNLISNGTQNSPITFRGVGYETQDIKYRVRWSGIKIYQDSLYTYTEATSLKNCNFYDADSVCLYIDKNNANSALELQDINFNYPNSGISLNGGKTIFNRVNFNEFSNVNPINLGLLGAWYFKIGDLNIGTNENLICKDLNITTSENAPGRTYNILDIIQSDPNNKINVSGSILLRVPAAFNCDINISNIGQCTIQALNVNSVIDSTVIKFSQNHGITCQGILSISAHANDTLSFRTNGEGKWSGIVTSGSPSINISNARFMDSYSALKINDNRGDCNIQHCRFFRNYSTDLILSNYSFFTDILPLIDANIFEGIPLSGASIICQSGNNVQISSNLFTNIYTVGLFLSGSNSALVKLNTFEATLSSEYSPIGIYSYLSGGNFLCNNITSFSDGILLDNSSPSLYNNKIQYNGYGLYLTNSSNPIMAPSYGQGQTLTDAGFNQIHDNLNSEIFCNNITTALSLPYLYNGSNSIYDNHGGYLIETNYWGGTLDANDNYWAGDPAGRFYPDGSVIYNTYLTDPPSEPTCDPTLMIANNGNIPNEIILLGNANIDYYSGNYNSAINKYHTYINTINTTNKIFLPLSRIFYATSLGHGDFSGLESYYNLITQQYINDTIIHYRTNDLSIGSKVNQPEYEEAISDYTSVINNSTNWYSSHYANIDKANTIILMLDSLLNGYSDRPSGNNHQNHLNLPVSNIQVMLNNLIQSESTVRTNTKNNIADSKDNKANNLRIQKNKENFVLKPQVNVSKISFEDIIKNLNQIKNCLIKNFGSNLNKSSGMATKKELSTQLFHMSVYKMIENALLNYVSFERPLMRVKNEKGKKGNNLIDIPKTYSLAQNYPNPFNPTTKIKFDIPKESKVIITIYDILGKEVTTLVNENKKPGYYEAKFDGSNFASGVYFYRINAGDFNAVKKMVLVK